MLVRMIRIHIECAARDKRSVAPSMPSANLLYSQRGAAGKWESESSTCGASVNSKAGLQRLPDM